MKICVLCDDRYHPGNVVTDGLQFLRGAGHVLEFATAASTGTLSKAMADLIILCKGQIEGNECGEGLWMDAELEKWFVEFVRSGGKLLVVHSGVVIEEKNRAFRSLVGGSFSHHPEACPIVYSTVGDFLTGAGIDDMEVHDEHYFIDLAVEKESLEIFLEGRSNHGCQPAGWFRKEGSGLVGVLTPGHFPAVWRQPHFKQLLTLCIDRLGGSR
ncbi:ThuA domain-containing protein [Puniceicoccales bacterium CK1056]|uniref:ThuA domain-containing protein n=1 Tax=Oceanipulchritudo coccoides TaxID=2706888 RepID=A0A6B2M3S2_9BACT|nr:ThuA domain-containing protein [Oceanipulchritudo coccoides]NDV62859.1 ThuA domain-containing protein [Oceanipulchritudo coccoides]